MNKKNFVADVSWGVGVIAGPWQLTFTQMQRSRKFKTQPEAHNDFGSVTLSRAF